MHDAYSLHGLLKLPLCIESVASHGDHLFIGTKQGHLLMYYINFANSGNPAVQLLRSNKYFSKKPILQLSVVPEYSILIALTDNIISVHDIDMAVTNFPLISQVQRTKGTHLFALDVVRTQTLTGESAAAVRMVVSVRRKLQFYYWKNRKFHELREDISVPDVAKSLAWCRESVSLGFRSDYSLLRLDDGEKLAELFPTGKSQEPRVTLMEDSRFALSKDEQTTFISSEGKMNLQAVQWLEAPRDMVHDQPYLIGVLSKSIEIRTEEPRLLIQSIEMLKPKLITRGKGGRLYCASQNQVWSLNMVPVCEQVPQLLRDKQFELAVMVANNVSDHTLENKQKTIVKIKTLFAFDLFCQGNKFKDSLDIFYELEIDPSHVIGLFDGLLPLEFQSKLEYPDTIPTLQGRQMENGLLALIEYLTQVRHKLNSNKIPSEFETSAMVEGVQTITSKKQLLQIIDTTLLKCYIKTNDALVASLLRLKDNHCHLEEAERVLLKNRKLTELVILYNTRNLHRKALELLQKYSREEESELFGFQRIISYLQNLGGEHVDMILEFSLDILSEDEEGFLIFTEDIDTVESLPRAKVLEFIIKHHQDYVIPYLEHVILVWMEKGALFHNALILQYKDLIMSRYNEGESVDHSDKTRSKLMGILGAEPCLYDPSAVLSQFPYSHLYEERAILLGRAGRYREALIIYIHVLHDLDLALNYCKNIKQEQQGRVYQHLVSLLVQPPLQTELPGLELTGDTRAPDLDAAITILEQYGSEMDLLAVLQSLPVNANLSKLAKFLSIAISSKVSVRNEVSVMKGLKHSEHLHVQEERIGLESTKIILSEFSFCSVCGKRFTSLTAFVRLPNGALAHYSCALDK